VSNCKLRFKGLTRLSYRSTSSFQLQAPTTLSAPQSLWSRGLSSMRLGVAIVAGEARSRMRLGRRRPLLVPSDTGPRNMNLGGDTDSSEGHAADLSAARPVPSFVVSRPQTPTNQTTESGTSTRAPTPKQILGHHHHHHARERVRDACPVSHEPEKLHEFGLPLR
jgi:hypothetical protein